MELLGIQKSSLIDYPEKICATVFTGGCNYRCPFCHNASLALSDHNDRKNSGSISKDDVIDFLSSRKKLLDGVCITGGEPTVHGEELITFAEKIKEMNYLIKLDTNGTCPEIIKTLVHHGLVDYIAMDIKNSPSKYSITAGVKNAGFDNVCKSADILMNENIDFEFRTTVVKPIHTQEDFVEIAEWLRGEEKYYIQNFKESDDILARRTDREKELKPFSEEELEEFVNILKDGGITNAFLREIK